MPFSSQSDTGSVLIRGMGLVPFSSLHKVRLTCGLAEGDVVLGVCPRLPVEGVHIIFGEWAGR